MTFQGMVRIPAPTFKKIGRPFMQFTGDQELPLSRGAAWRKLSDVRFLVQCVPGGEKIEQAEETRAVCTLRPGFAFVRGTLELTIERREAEPEQALCFAMHGKGVGSSSDVESRLTLEEKDGRTYIRWTAEVTKLGGLLKAVPPGLIRGAAQKVIQDMWKNVTAKLSEEPADS
jgi:carbon monoxide dehydrogenase subunit G